MKKSYSFLAALALAVFAFSLMAAAVFASGDKVRGDNGEGSVIQNCILMPEKCPPFPDPEY